MSGLDIANPFVDTALGFLNSQIGTQFTKGPLITSEHRRTSQEINIIIGIVGTINGQVTYGMSLDAAKTISATMLGRQTDLLDRAAQSALCELGNMISGSALGEFGDWSLDLALTPPILIAGKNIFIPSVTASCMRATLISGLGEVDVTVTLKAEKPPQQAHAV